MFLTEKFNSAHHC